MKKLKGLTLIEVVITFAILIIIMGILFPSFISSYRGFNKTTVKSDLQHDAERIIRDITKIAMEAEKVSSIDGADIGETSTVYKIDGITKKNIQFTSGSRFVAEKAEINGFEVNTGILYRVPIYPVAPKISIGENLEYIEVAPLDGVKFKDSMGIKITIVMKKKDIEYSMSDIVYFRNKK
ncbi:hypothetical protein SDC9_100012 [bioreactor metagenome]|uniref:General secretion pathway GspH domain-containing protein n=1 Tax=bioreactor metagenome TaxID=1076179 RepID=A0A645AJP3_9ZZZZ